MENILNLINVKTSTETYGSYSGNLDTDTFFIQYDYFIEMFRLIRVNGVVFLVVGIVHSETLGAFEYKIKLYYGTY